MRGCQESARTLLDSRRLARLRATFTVGRPHIAIYFYPLTRPACSRDGIHPCIETSFQGEAYWTGSLLAGLVSSFNTLVTSVHFLREELNGCRIQSTQSVEDNQRSICVYDEWLGAVLQTYPSIDIEPLSLIP